MKQTKRLLALLLILLLTLAGCRDESVESVPPTDSPEPSVSTAPVDSEEPSEVIPEEPAADDPGETELPENGPLPYEVEETLIVGEQEVPAVRRYDVGYSVAYLPSEVTLTDWAEGETYELTDAAGTYLAVSRVWGSSISEAVAGLQFEYAIESEPTGFIFGAEGYAGVRMTVTAGGLTAEYILFQNGDTIYLVERAIFTGGEDYAVLLQAMMDSIIFE